MKFFLLLLLVVVAVLLGALFLMTGSPAPHGVEREWPRAVLSETDAPTSLSRDASADDHSRNVVDVQRTEPTRADLERKLTNFGKKVTEAHEEPREPAPGSLAGHIVDPLHRDPPLGGGKLVLRFEAPEPGSAEDRPGARRGRNDVRVDVFTSGAYEAKDLALGTWTASCRIAGCPPVEARIVLAHGSEHALHDFVFDANRVLRVALRDPDGRPLLRKLKQESSALANLLAPFAWAAEPAIGESAGASSKPLALRSNLIGNGDSDAWCHVAIEASSRELLWVGVVLGDRTLAYRDVPPGADEVVLRVGLDDVHKMLGGVEISVVDDWSSLPLASAAVMLPGSPGQPKFVTADERGHVTFDSVLPGDMQIVARAEGYVEIKSKLLVDAGRITKWEARLEPAVRIAGRITKEGKTPGQRWVLAIPVGGPVITRLEHEGLHRLDPSTYVKAFVRLDRTFAFEGLSHGEYVLMGGSAGGTRDEIEKCTKESAPPGYAFIDARAGSVSGVVLKGEAIEPDLEWHDSRTVTGQKTQLR